MALSDFRPFKLAWFFNWFPLPGRTGGWEETWYFWAPDQPGAETVAASLRRARLDSLMSAPGLTLAFQRISEVTSPYTMRLDAIGSHGSFTGPPQPISGPWDGYKVSLQSQTFRERTVEFRGAPIGVGLDWSLPIRSGAWNDAFQAFLKALIANKGSLQVQSVLPRFVVTGVRALGPGSGQVVVTAPGHGLPVGQTLLVSFRLLRCVPTLTGRHRVLVGDKDNVQVLDVNIGRIFYPGGGFLSLLGYSYDPIVSGDILQAGLRKRHRGYRLASWTTANPQASIGFHPCGLAMDVLSSCCTIDMRFGLGQGPTPARWFWCPLGTPVFPGWHSFGAQIWNGNWRIFFDLGDIGEIPGQLRPWNNGAPGAPWGFQNPAGPGEYFVQGEGLVYLSLVRRPDGVPVACNPHLQAVGAALGEAFAFAKGGSGVLTAGQAQGESFALAATGGMKPGTAVALGEAFAFATGRGRAPSVATAVGEAFSLASTAGVVPGAGQASGEAFAFGFSLSPTVASGQALGEALAQGFSQTEHITFTGAATGEALSAGIGAQVAVGGPFSIAYYRAFQGGIGNLGHPYTPAYHGDYDGGVSPPLGTGRAAGDSLAAATGKTAFSLGTGIAAGEAFTSGVGQVVYAAGAGAALGDSLSSAPGQVGEAAATGAAMGDSSASAVGVAGVQPGAFSGAYSNAFDALGRIAVPG
jgi:hypothetical protein